MSRVWCETSNHLRSLSTEAAGELDVFALDGDTLCVNRTQVSVFEQGYEVGLNGLLEGTDGGRLEAQVRFEVLSDLTNKTLEGELSDEELGGLLVATDLTESDGTRLISVGLLDTSGRWCRLASSLGSKLLTRSLATGRLSGGLLGTSHC